MEAQKPAVASSSDSSNASNLKRPRKWLFIPVLIVIGVTFYFFHDISQRNSHVNNENYRLLYEASVEFNNNLNKLRRAHQNGESGTAIRGLFASYKNSREGKDAFNNAIYQLKARKLVVQNTNGQALGDELASLSDSDILPQSASVFSKVLIVNERDKVLTTLGNETKISFSDLSFITKSFIKSQQSIFATTSNKTAPPNGNDQKLPTHSSHVDVKLAHGDYRVYVFPFTLEQELAYPAPNLSKGYNKTTRLTLVGFVENIELSKRATSKWNIPLIVISVLTLCVLVAVLRLYLQPKNQFTTRFFRGFVVVTCYLAFSASLALVLASVESQYLTHIKTRATERYITALADQFNTEVYQIFNAAHRYRPFYQTLSKLSRKASFQGNSLKNYCFDLQTPKGAQDRHTIPLLVNLEQEGAYCRSNAANNLTVSYATASSDSGENSETAETSNASKAAPERLVNNHTSFTGLNTNKSGQAFKQVVNNINTTLPSREAGQGSVGILAKSLALIEPTGKSVAGVKLADHEATLVLPDGLISLLALNRYGNPALPSFYYRENFSTPRTINLSHRQYFKKVRDQQGWHLPLSKDITDASRTMRNVYIQRLRNVTNGTTGTTLSMPLFEHVNESIDGGNDWNEGSLVLIADVLIPAMEYFQLAAVNAEASTYVSTKASETVTNGNQVKSSYTNTTLKFEHLAQLKPSAIYADLTHMVLDRNTGQVLFHSQADRALNENIFYSGNNQQGLTEWIKSSGYQAIQTMQNREPVQVMGNYHGKAGTFFLHPTVIDDWALVVFAPSELSTWFQTNKFIYYLVVITLLMAVSFALVKGLSLAVNSHGKSHGRTKDVISHELQRRLGFIATNIIILVVTISAVVKLLPIDAVIWYLPLTLVILAVILYLMWFVWQRLPLYLFKDIRRLGRAIKRVPANLWLTVSVVFLLVFWYLSATSELSLNGVALQQQNYQCALINAKREEITKQALTLFPNSITNYQQQPAALMLGNNRYLENAACDNTSVTPNDFPNFATAVGNQQLWRWLHAYMLPKSSTERVQLDAEKPMLAMLGYTALMIILVTILSAIWYLLHSKVLWTFLYFGMDFLRHIEKLGQDLADIPTDKRDARLLIKGDNIRLNGVELNLYTSLLKRDKLETQWCSHSSH